MFCTDFCPEISGHIGNGPEILFLINILQPPKVIVTTALDAD